MKIAQLSFSADISQVMIHDSRSSEAFEKDAFWIAMARIWSAHSTLIHNLSPSSWQLQLPKKSHLLPTRPPGPAWQTRQPFAGASLHKCWPISLHALIHMVRAHLDRYRSCSTSCRSFHSLPTEACRSPDSAFVGTYIYIYTYICCTSRNAQLYELTVQHSPKQCLSYAAHWLSGLQGERPQGARTSTQPVQMF